MPNRLIHHLDQCPRCGELHENIVFEQLALPMEDPRGDFTHWAPCPTCAQPILLRACGSENQSHWDNNDDDDDDPANDWKKT